MTTSLRIVAVLLGLGGASRIVYADLIAVVPGMPQPTPALNVAIGLSILVAAIGLFLGYGWARWPSVIGAIVLASQGLAYVVWSLGHSADPVGVLFGLIEPVVASVIVVRLLRHWPPGVSWADRLR